MTGYRTPSWFRAKRNVELKQAKAKIGQSQDGKRKKRKKKQASKTRPPTKRSPGSVPSIAPERS